jgi:hypothetical protein
MTRYWIEVGCEIRTTSGDIESHFLAVMDALLEEPGAVDPDIAAELATGKIKICMAVDAATAKEALDRALLITRSAIHQAGGFTPDGDKSAEGAFFVTDGFDARVRPANMTSAC